MRNRRRCSSARPSLNRAMRSWMSMATWTAAAAEPNSASMASPVLWTREPPAPSMAGCQISLRADRRRSKVRSSSASTRRTKPARSACRIADSRRSEGGMATDKRDASETLCCATQAVKARPLACRNFQAPGLPVKQGATWRAGPLPPAPPRLPGSVEAVLRTVTVTAATELLVHRCSQHGARPRAVRNHYVSRLYLRLAPCPFVLELEALVKTAPELQSEARSNHDAAARALRMARGLTSAPEIERLERFAAELEIARQRARGTSRIRPSALEGSGPAERM